MGQTEAFQIYIVNVDELSLYILCKHYEIVTLMLTLLCLSTIRCQEIEDPLYDTRAPPTQSSGQARIQASASKGKTQFTTH